MLPNCCPYNYLTNLREFSPADPHWQDFKMYLCWYLRFERCDPLLQNPTWGNPSKRKITKTAERRTSQKHGKQSAEPKTWTRSTPIWSLRRQPSSYIRTWTTTWRVVLSITAYTARKSAVCLYLTENDYFCLHSYKANHVTYSANHVTYSWYDIFCARRLVKEITMLQLMFFSQHCATYSLAGDILWIWNPWKITLKVKCTKKGKA